MACLERLQVQGIRSFNPEKPEKIDFFPLTIILGANGAGKTTLIECLRYAATNDFPPHTNRGKTWIHDIQCTKSHTIKCQVKLGFKDVEGERCVISRSLELVAKRERTGKVVPQMRTLDAIIKRGNDTVVSSKCAEIDTVMLDLLGVSKSVLSDVIFCHQEESNWPLSESKVLKEKFDQLFGSVGYVKALKKIKDERTEYLKKKALFESELSLFAEQKEQNEKYADELAKNEAQLKMLKDKIAKLTELLGPIKIQLDNICLKEKKIIDIEREISQIEGQCCGLKTTISQLQKVIREPFKGSELELRDKISQFSQTIESKQRQIVDDNRKLHELEQELSLYNSKLNSISVRKGMLEEKRSKNQSDVNQLKDSLEKIFNIMNIDAESYISKLDSDVDFGLREVKDLLDLQEERFYAKLQSLIKEQRKGQKEIESQLERLKSKRSKLEQSIKINQEEAEKKKLESEDVVNNLDSISKNSSTLNSLSQELDEQQKKLEKIEGDNSLEGLQKKIMRLQVNVRCSKANLNNLRKQKDELQLKNERLAVLNVHKQNYNKAKDTLTEIFDTQKNVFFELGIEFDDKDRSFADEIKMKINKIQRRLSSKEVDLEEKNEEKSKISGQLEREKAKLSEFKKELKEKESKIKTICGASSYDDFVESVEADLKKLRTKSGSSAGAQELLSDFSEKIFQGKCPVCNRLITEAKERSKIQADLIKKIQILPVEAGKLEKVLEEKENLHKELMRLKSDHEFVRNSKSEMSKISQNIILIQQKVDCLKQEVEKLQREIKKEKSELERTRAIESDALTYDKTSEILRECENQMKKLSKNLDFFDESSGSESTKTLEELTEEIEKISEDLRNEETLVEELQTKKDVLLENISRIKEKIINLESAKLEVQKGQQRQVSLRNKLSELKDKIKEHENACEAYESEIVSLEPKIEEAERKLGVTIEQNDIAKSEIEDSLNKIMRFKDEFGNLAKDVLKYIEDDVDDDLKGLEDEYKLIEEKIRYKGNKRTEISKKCQTTLKEINDAELTERNYKDNLDLIERTAELGRLREALAKKTSAKGAPDNVGLLRKKQELDKVYSEKNQSLQQTKGKQEPIVARCRELRDELAKDKYLKAKDNYSKKLLHVMEVDSICEDLNKLYKALDHSVMTFHNKKMQEINKYLYKLWKHAYRGNDIDHIKIVSDTEGGLASDKRRSFNYRVVMVRNRIEMDMRGRCSAGQKVIASLVIRLALAEIFSLNCGILTLDEPTTNLDKDNIQAFADSVVSIVNSHRNRNFQLIIITHDDQFLKCLKDSDCEFYYSVQKDDKGYSKIEQLSIKERDDN